MKHIYVCLLLLFTVFFTYAQDVNFIDDAEIGYERIKHFHSDIVIHEDGDITVTENITFYVTGQNIQRGIVRSLPYYYRNQSGKKKTIKTKILSITKNGAEERYHQDILKGGEFGARELYIGSDDEFLTLGTYTYQISYRVSDQIFHYDGFDELYWNVTGNDWAFSMDSVSATITLPNTQAINTSCYTGRAGSKAQNCRISVDSTAVSFYTVDKLYKNEGLTVAVSFESGIVAPPAPPSFYEKYLQQILAALSICILGLYYLITWLKVGRPGAKPIVIPTFKPPLGLSPSVIEYLYKLKMKDSILSTAIVSMAVKGILKIERINNKYNLINLGQNKNKLSEEELSVYDTLFSTNTTQISLSGTYIPSLTTAMTNLSSSLNKQHDIKKLKLPSFNYLFIGALLSLLSLHIYFFVGDYYYSEEAYSILLIFGVVLVSSLLTFTRLTLFVFLGYIIGIFSIFLWLMLVIVTFFKSLASSEVSDFMNLTSLIFVLVVLFAYSLYCYFFNTKTAKGLEVESQLEGFRLYLKTAEEHRLNMLMTPQHTLQLFEELLPYAIALGVENEWNSKFKDELLSNYQPNWYSGDKSFNTLGSSFASSFSSSINKASTKPSQSGGSGGRSGSSGGGSSGGGRGGGGGRGW